MSRSGGTRYNSPVAHTPKTRRKGGFVTDTLNCDGFEGNPIPAEVAETAFERPRGIAGVEIRGTFAQVHVSGFEGDVMRHRIEVLRRVKDAGINLDFLKLTNSGMAFLIQESDAATLKQALEGHAPRVTVRSGRHIVMVHGANMRDEAGSIAGIVSMAIATGAKIDHLGDMHDRMLLVAEQSAAETIAARLRKELN